MRFKKLFSKTVAKGATIIVIFAFFSTGLKAQQQNPQIIFDQANQLLQQGKTVQALDRYQQLVERGQLSGALFINMGYSYTRLGELGKAKYYFLKAKQFEETRKEARSGLKYVESQLSHQSGILPALPWEKALKWLQVAIGPALLLGIGLVLLNIGIFVLVGSWFREKSPSFIQKTATGIAAAGMLVVLLSFYIDYRRQRYSKAVMVTQKANVLKKPTQESRLINKAFEGYSFTVDHKKSKSSDSWVFVQMSNGSEGWIKKEEIMIL